MSISWFHPLWGACLRVRLKKERRLIAFEACQPRSNLLSQKEVIKHFVPSHQIWMETFANKIQNRRFDFNRVNDMIKATFTHLLSTDLIFASYRKRCCFFFSLWTRGETRVENLPFFVYSGKNEFNHNERKAEKGEEEEKSEHHQSSDQQDDPLCATALNWIAPVLTVRQKPANLTKQLSQTSLSPKTHTELFMGVNP